MRYVHTLKTWWSPAPACELCHADGAGTLPLCEGCYTQLPWITVGCMSCGEPLPHNSKVLLPRAPASLDIARHCTRCEQAPLPFTDTIVPLRYGFPVDQWIGALKYQERPGMADWLAQLLGGEIERRWHTVPTLITGVPMHPQRQRQRGYNQSLLLARALARRLQLPYVPDVLEKSRATRHQRTLNAASRRLNLQDAFRVTRKLSGKIAGQQIALVDDVITTGATSAEIAKVLLNAGATNVCLWALAKTPMHTPR